MRAFVALLVLTALLLASAGGYANSKDGPRRWTRTVKKNSEVVYKVVFVADASQERKFAEFAVIGDGGTDIDLEVFDQAGKLVAKDVFFSDLALVRWVPAATQEFTIKVKNLGSEDNVCIMGHN